MHGAVNEKTDVFAFGFMLEKPCDVGIFSPSGICYLTCCQNACRFRSNLVRKNLNVNLNPKL